MVNQSKLFRFLEDMLRACVLDLKDSWEEHFPLVEFAYNNIYQASIQMALYEELYKRLLLNRFSNTTTKD